MINTLDHYLEQKILTSQLTKWAEVLKMNEHLNYEEPFSQIISDALFQLASPEINGGLSHGMCRSLKNKNMIAQKSGLGNWQKWNQILKRSILSCSMKAPMFSGRPLGSFREKILSMKSCRLRMNTVDQ